MGCGKISQEATASCTVTSFEKHARPSVSLSTGGGLGAAAAAAQPSPLCITEDFQNKSWHSFWWTCPSFQQKTKQQAAYISTGPLMSLMPERGEQQNGQWRMDSQIRRVSAPPSPPTRLSHFPCSSLWKLWLAPKTWTRTAFLAAFVKCVNNSPPILFAAFLHLYRWHFSNYKMHSAGKPPCLNSSQFSNSKSTSRARGHPLSFGLWLWMRPRTSRTFKNQYLTLSIFILLCQYKNTKVKEQ